MSQKYEERIKRAKAHNNETKKRIQENTQQIYEERLSCDNRADDIEMMAALEELQKKYPDELADVQLEGVGTIKSDVRNAYEAVKNEKSKTVDL